MASRIFYVYLLCKWAFHCLIHFRVFESFFTLDADCLRVRARDFSKAIASLSGRCSQTPIKDANGFVCESAQPEPGVPLRCARASSTFSSVSRHPFDKPLG